jgi:hypothetical protein
VSASRRGWCPWFCYTQISMSFSIHVLRDGEPLSSRDMLPDPGSYSAPVKL